jgi:YegS/Rv2252/BmrU family lipid kinase
MRALLLFNANSGQKGSHRRLPEAIDILRQAGWQVEPVATDSPGDTQHLASTAGAAGFEVVVAVGGDGTVNVVANGLLSADRNAPQAALGILPAGTGKVLARDLGLPAPLPGVLDTLPETARWLTRSRPAWVDAGKVTNAQGQRFFLCWAGVGLDAAITAHVSANPVAKRWLGYLAFVASAAGHIMEIHRSPDTIVQVDEQLFQGRGVLTVVSNIHRYAVVFDMAPAATMDDGALDMTFFHSVTIANGLGMLWKLSTAQHIDDPSVGYAAGRAVRIVTETPQPVHVDAEPFGETPVVVEVVPRGLRMMTPPTEAAARLVSNGGRQ